LNNVLDNIKIHLTLDPFSSSHHPSN